MNRMTFTQQKTGANPKEGFKPSDVKSNLIRNNLINEPEVYIKNWLKEPCTGCKHPIEAHQIILKKYNVLLEVICDDYLETAYRNTCLQLINYCLFNMRELESNLLKLDGHSSESKSLLYKQNEAYKNIRALNQKTFYEFRQCFQFFKQSLRG